MKFNNGLSSTVQKTGRVITLPYSEIPLIKQNHATKYRSTAHVAFAWNGSIILLPCYNNNININQTAAVNITQNNATPWQQFANSPFGSVWGPWQTTQSVTTNTNISGTASTLNINLGYRGTYQSAYNLVQTTAAQYQAAGYQIGSLSYPFYSSYAINPNYSVSSTSTAVSSDTSQTMITNLGSTPNYSNIGVGAPIFQS